MTLSTPNPSDEYGEVTLVVPPHIVNHIISEHGDVSDDIIMEHTYSYLDLGFRAAMIAGSSLDTGLLKEVITTGSENFSDQSHTLINDLGDVRDDFEELLDSKVLGDNSEFEEKVREVIGSFETILLGMSDTSNEGSLAHTVQLGTSTKVQEAVDVIEEAMDLGIPSSFASKLICTIDDKLLPVFEKVASIETQQKEHQDALAVSLGLKDSLDNSLQTHPGKGVDFEDEVFDALLSITSVHSDTCEDIGYKTDGVSKSKNGDQLCQVMMTDGTCAGSIVIEDKSGKFTLTGSKSIQKELSDAMSDTAATAAIAVVDLAFAPKSLQKRGVMRIQPQMYVLGIDRSEGDFRSLSFLYQMVRLQVIADYHNSNANTNQVDPSVIEGLCKAGIAELKEINTLRKALKESVSDTALNVANKLDILYNSHESRYKSIMTSFGIDIEGGTS